MYKTCTTTTQVCVDMAFGEEDNFWVNGVITYKVSITRDFGYYGSRSDDGPPDPDQVDIINVESYNLLDFKPHDRMRRHRVRQQRWCPDFGRGFLVGLG